MCVFGRCHDSLFSLKIVLCHFPGKTPFLFDYCFVSLQVVMWVHRFQAIAHQDKDIASIVAKRMCGEIVCLVISESVGRLLSSSVRYALFE